MILSFAWTTDAFLKGIKTKTRRRFSDRQFNTWLQQWKMYTDKKVHTAVDKALYAGGKRIGGFVLTAAPYRERLGDMPVEDLAAEGGMWKTVEEFIKFVKGNHDEIVMVLTFRRI